MANDKARGAQFDILDKAVAARFWDLYNRPGGIFRQDVDRWLTDYNQLKAYAQANSDVAYVARQWRDEEPRYSKSVEHLMSKVKPANPANYDTSIRVKGCGDGCNCGRTPIPQLSYTPMTIPTGGGMPFAPGNAPTVLSFGDSMRNMFSPATLPFFPEPDTPGEQIAKDSITGIIVAVVIAIILWGFHFLKKRAN